jgi:Lon protease-like protein
MQRQGEHAVDILGMAHITRKSGGAIEMADPRASRLSPGCIARQQNDARSFLHKHFGDRLANAHRSASDDDYFAHEFHARVVFDAAPQVKMQATPCRKTVSYNLTTRAILQVRIGDCLALLPLFPLDLVLLPGTPLPLHIFEPRYKEMIGECRANDAPFGVVRALEDGIAEIGCTAEIVTVTKEYPDGRMDLVAEGRERFEVLELNRERSFLRAEVLLVPDEPSAPDQQERTRAIQAHLEILTLAGAVQDLSAAEPGALSFYLAGSLPLDLDFKQNLLTMKSESQRIQAVATYLESILPNLRRASRTREKAGGNGHAR